MTAFVSGPSGSEPECTTRVSSFGSCHHRHVENPVSPCDFVATLHAIVSCSEFEAVDRRFETMSRDRAERTRNRRDRREPVIGLHRWELTSRVDRHGNEHGRMRWRRTVPDRREIDGCCMRP